MRVSRRGVASAGALALIGVSAAVAPTAFAGKPPAPTISVVQFSPSGTQLTATEGQPGALQIVVTRSNSTGTATFNLSPFDGTATLNSDYVPLWSNPLTIGPGATSTTVSMQIVNDAVAEKTETMTLLLTSAAPDTQIGKKNSATVTIFDNDPCAAVSVNDHSIPEGGSGTFTVSMPSACALPVQVHWSVADNTPTPDATGGGNTYPADYNNTQSGNVAIPSGSTSTTFSVSSNQDTVDEPDQTFRVLLSSPINTSISDGTGVATIIDDDAPVVATIGPDQTVWAGGTAHFAVNLSAPSEWTVVVTVVTDDADNAPGSVVSDAPGTDVTFPPGATTEPYAVSTLGTTTAALNVLDWVKIAGAQHATFSDPSVVYCIACTTDSWGRLFIKNTVPDHTTVVTDAANPVTDGTSVTETATFMNMSGDGLPHLTIRGEIWRDDVDPGSGDEADGNFYTSTDPGVGFQTDANGQVISSYTGPPAGTTATDWLIVCVPGFAGASLSDCGTQGGPESDGETLLNTPTQPTAMTSVNWAP